jgi:hypothetical protein
MKIKNSPPRCLRLDWARLALLAACLLASCEGRDASLQSELAQLREKVRRAEQERDQALRDKSNATKPPSGAELQPLSALEGKFDEAAKRFEQDVIATFPGYRPASIRRGKFAYLLDEEDPYRTPVELSLRPNSASALTPDVPPVVFEARATKNGEWKMPGQAALREMQAVASARAASESQAGRPALESPSASQPSKGANSRTISWGDGASSASQRPQPPQDPPAARATPGTSAPRASESYEIRFKD